MFWIDIEKESVKEAGLKAGCRNVLAVLVFLTSVAAPCAAGMVRHNSGYGFSFDIPEDWVQIPQAEVEATAAKLSMTGASSNLMVLSAFQPEGEKWFAYPYVMVQLVRYPEARPPTEAEMRSMVKAFSQVNVSKTLKGPGVTPQMRNIARTATISAGDFDPFSKKYTIPVEIRAPGIGKVRGKIVGHFGKRHLIQMCCYDREDTFVGSEVQFATILDSFRWDEHSDIPESKVGGRGTIIAMGAGAAVVLLGMLLSGARKPPAPNTARPHPASEDAPWR